MSVESITLITAIVGAVCGITGAALGIINTWHQLQRNRVRLKVTPQHAIAVSSLGNHQVNFCIEVVNLSEFAVVVSDVGFRLIDGSRATLATVQGLEQEGSLPLRLEPRTRYSKVFLLDGNTAPNAKITKAYARTTCGKEIYGTSGALRQRCAENEEAR